MDLAKKKVTVFGLGKSGEAVAALIASQGGEVLVVDDEQKDPPKSLTTLKSDIPVRFRLGDFEESDFLSAELVVVSPGVPLSRLPLEALSTAAIPVIGEMELASRFVVAPIIAITGTNGKSTTTTLVADILKESGFRVFLGGNIGTPLSLAAFHPFDYIVLEVSSFQLETITTFRPKIAALLNVTEDHLDRHDTMENYRKLKERIFENQKRVDYAVLNADSFPPIPLFPSSYPNTCKSIPAWFSRKGDALMPRQGVTLVKDMIVSSITGREEAVIAVKAIRLSGTHNLENVIAAITISLLAGASLESIQKVVSEFSGLPHRMEFVREVKGVRYINDSKGTNVGSVLKSLEGMNAPVILIAGGLDKGSDFTLLREIIFKKVKRLILMGDAVEKMLVAFKGHSAVDKVHSMQEAVLLASASGAKGEAVLLSPGCASFDMFKNYAHRGDVFKKAVLELSS
ncbi:MAG: UDP-N-acetylmuramoyl-L-alanine--D-glutamate ligase [Nitrospirota bacterium]